MNRLICFFGVCFGRPHPDAKTHADLAAIAPHVRGANNQARINRWRLYALIPVIVAAIVNIGLVYFQWVDTPFDWRDRVIEWYGQYHGQGPGAVVFVGLLHVLPIFAVAYITGAFWEGLFAHLRGRSREPGLLVTVLLFTALLPPAAPLWHVALGMSFAIVFAQEVFGGHGKTFLPPALVGLAVLQVSFPSALADHPVWTMLGGYGGTTAFTVYVEEGLRGFVWIGIDVISAGLGNMQGAIGASSVVAALLGAVVLLVGGVANWRPMVGVAVGVALAVWLTGWGLDWHWHMLLGGGVFCAVFIATDAAGSSATNAGRLIQGLLAGTVVVLIRVYNPAHPDGVVAAFLFAAILSPLIDAAVVRLQVRIAKVVAARRRARL